MAKKQAINYSPNTGLIAGARDVARSEAMVDSAGGAAFAQGLTGAVMTGIEEQKKRNAKMDAHLDNLDGIQNISLLEEDYNKGAVTNFVRNGRDEYAELAASYEKTKDRATLDKMDAIKFSFQNLNTQLQGLAQEKKGYLNAYDKKQLVTLGNGDEKFTDMYTNNSQFSVEANGDIGFGSGDMYSKFKDVAGKWNTENNLHKTFTLKTMMDQGKMGASGKDFQRDNVKNSFNFNLKETGPEGIMVMGITDMTGDSEHVVGQDNDGNDIVAKDMSFRSMWREGYLSDKFYKKFPKGSDPKWITNKDNTDHLADLISEYGTDVAEFTHKKEKGKYDAKEEEKRSYQDVSGKKTYIGRSRIDNSSIYASQEEIKDKYDRITNAQNGDIVEGWDGKREYRYVYEVSASGDPFWREQNWDAKLGQFVTKGGNKGVKHLNTNDVINEFIPQSMLQNSNATSGGGADNLK